jgi:hypothetical protein
MEQFFIVPEGTKAYQHVKDYKANTAVVNDTVKQFLPEHGIEASQYYCTESQIYIVPTEKDVAEFKTQLAAEVSDGLRPFKKNSKVGKAWASMNVKVLSKPFVPFWFTGAMGKMKTRLFEVGDVVYCSIETAYEKPLKPNEEFKELKASEFWKIVEDSEQREGKGNEN